MDKREILELQEGVQEATYPGEWHLSIINTRTTWCHKMIKYGEPMLG